MNYQKQFQYNEQIIGHFIDCLKQNENASDKSSLWLSHVINALDIWVRRIQETESSVKVWDVHTIQELHQMNRECHREIFKLLDIGNLHGIHSYTNSKGDAFQNTLDEILTHLIIHSGHHRAQIAADWSASGIRPPVSDFIYWARKQQ